MKTMQKVIVLLLVLAMAMSCLPMGALATEAEEITQVETTPVEVLPEEAEVPEETEPVIEETEPVIKETEPVIEETEPVIEETEPIIEETKPVIEETKPVIEETKPVIEETEPVIDENEPTVVEESANTETDSSTPTIVKSGTCGENLTWTLDSEGLLVISGTGDMYSYRSPQDPPWFYLPVKKVIVEHGVTSIGAEAFYPYNSKLFEITEIILPSTLKRIEHRAFYSSTIQQISIPDSVDTIESSAFANSSIRSVHLPYGLTTIQASTFDGCYALREVTIPNTVTVIERSAFQDCRKLERIDLPSSVKTIEDYAFDSCASLKHVSLPDSITTLKASVFEDCVSLEEVTLPKKLTNISFALFRGCSKLKSIIFPDKITIIEDDAFRGCTSLEYMEIPNSVTTLEGCVFMDCTSLEMVVLPINLTTIANMTFADCSSLVAIVIPAKLTKINDNAFTRCSKLTEVYYLGTEAQLKRIRVSTTGNDAIFEANWYLATIATKQPKDVKTIAGKTVNFTTAASRSNCKFQWYYLKPGAEAGVACSGTSAKKATYSFTAKANMDGYQYFCVITDEFGGQVTTYPATLTIVSAPKITKQPEDAMAKSGETISVSVEATGEGLTYTWYYAKKGSTKFTKSSITTNTYATTMDASRDGRKVYCVVKDAYGQTVKSQTATLWLETTPLVIEKQPESVTVKYGETAQVSVEAKGDGLTYAWYYAKAGATKFSKSSTTKNTYSATMDASRDGRQVYCVITDVYGKTAKTETVTLNMEKVPLVITQQPESVTVKYGETAQVSVEAKGDGLTYTWYYAKAGATKFSKSSTTKNTYSATMDASRDGRQVYCVITDVYGKTAKTETVTLNMEKVPLAITKQPENVSTKYGEKVSVAVEAEGDGLTYTWYFAKKGSTKFSKSSITKNTYSTTMDSAKDGRKIYCVVKDAYGKTLKTEVVTLTLVRVPFAITKQPESVRVKYGETASVTVEAEGDGLTYTWYFAKKGSTKFSKSSTTKNTYSVKMSQSNNGRKVYCVVKDAYGKTKKTETVTLNYEKTPLKIVRQPEVACLAVGESHDITLIAEGDGLTYQWYYTKDPAKYTQYSKSSVTRSVYPVTMTADKDGRRLYCIVKDAYGNSVKSDVVWIYIDW